MPWEEQRARRQAMTANAGKQGFRLAWMPSCPNRSGERSCWTRSPAIRRRDNVHSARDLLSLLTVMLSTLFVGSVQARHQDDTTLAGAMLRRAESAIALWQLDSVTHYAGLALTRSRHHSRKIAA